MTHYLTRVGAVVYDAHINDSIGAPMATMTAYKAGPCATCKGAITVGETFKWGKAQGQRVHVVCPEQGEAGVQGDEPSASAQRVTLDFTGLTPANGLAPVDTDTRVWSNYQKAVFDFGVNSTKSGIIYGVAGCAKTTTIEEMARRLPEYLAIKYLVFNKRNADEAKVRMPSHVDASTFHSSCFTMLSRRLHRPQVVDNKVWKLADEIVRKDVMDRNGDKLVKLVGLGKNSGIGALAPTLDIHDQEAWRDLIEEYGIEFDLKAQVKYSYDEDDDGSGRDDDAIEAEIYELCRYAGEMLEASNADTATVDFDDMLYLTVLLDVPLPRFDIVCVDEAQDTNQIQRAILHKMVKAGGRLIAVGDPKQAIYHFRGASADAMDLIRDEFDCEELPLSINYRCSQAVVREAQRYCPQLEAWDQSPEGSVEHLTEWEMSQFLPTDAILCRLNAPIIQLAMRMLKRGMPCKVLGRDIGKSLVALIDKVTRKQRKTSLDNLEMALNVYLRTEVARLTRRKEDSKIELVQDKVESLLAVAENLSDKDATAQDLVNFLNGMFADQTGQGIVTLSTVHKAKGLEYPRVFVLNRSAMPSKWAKLPAQYQQEHNLIYVSYTRAKVDLRTIELKDIK